MSKKLYVGNMNYATTEDKLREVFKEFGEIESINMITDRATGQFRGFAFVEMTTEDAAQAAIAGLNGQELDGRQLRVNLAQNKKPGGGGGGFNAGNRWQGGKRERSDRFEQRF